MPTGMFASYYWPGDGEQGAAPPADVPDYGYPYMFDGAYVGMFMGWVPGLGRLLRLKTPRTRYWWERHIKTARRWWHWLVHHLLPERLWILGAILRMVWSSTYQDAREAVRWVAVHPETRRVEHWTPVNWALTTQHPQTAENILRGLAAQVAFRKVNTTASNTDMKLATELAYTALKARGH